MKQGMILADLCTELQRQRDTKVDYLARQDALRFELASPEPGNLPTLYIPKTDHAPLPIRPHAHTQFAQRLGIPGQYYNRMMQQQPELLVRNVNTWLAQNDERRMVRALDGNVRAFLSDRYQRIENFDVAEVALGVLGDMGDMQVVSCAVTEARLYIKAVFPKIRRDVARVGDTIQAGVLIKNSETGLGSFDVEGFAEVLACTNGMVLPDARFKRAHIGGRVGPDSDDSSILADDTKRADDTAIMLKARDYIRAAADAAVFEKRVEKMREASTRMITGNPAESVEVLAQRASLTEFEKGGVMRHLIAGGDISQWGLINAVTRTAQDCESYDRATDLEALGGRMINLSPTEWREIAEAA